LFLERGAEEDGLAGSFGNGQRGAGETGKTSNPKGAAAAGVFNSPGQQATLPIPFFVCFKKQGLENGAVAMWRL